MRPTPQTIFFPIVIAGLIWSFRSGYGGWFLYTAASAGDLGFVHELPERDPLLVFGEGEYGVTDILYAAAKRKNCKVFRLVFYFVVFCGPPRFSTDKGGEMEEQIGEIPFVFKWKMINRVVHATARGGNLKILKELLSEFWPNVRSKYVKTKSYYFLFLQIKNILCCIFLFSINK